MPQSNTSDHLGMFGVHHSSKEQPSAWMRLVPHEDGEIQPLLAAQDVRWWIGEPYW